MAQLRCECLHRMAVHRVNPETLGRGACTAWGLDGLRCPCRSYAREGRGKPKPWLEKHRLPPVAHRDDPESSHEAAAAVTQSGARDRHKDSVLEALQRYPGSLATELVEPTGLNVYEVRRRLSDLKASGQAAQGDLRYPRGKSRRREVTWWPREAASQGEMQL